MSVKIKIDKNKLKRNIQKQTVNILNNKTYEIECPHCHKKVTVPTGKSKCPRCHKEINLNLDIHLKR